MTTSAQSPVPPADECGLTPENVDDLTEEIPEATDPCFDEAAVQDGCILTWLNVNIHFFLDDNYLGDIAAAPNVQENLNIENAFVLAEQLISDANDFLEEVSQNQTDQNEQWNTNHHGAIATDAQCVPFRFVLKEVYIHNKTSAQATNVSFSEFNDFEENRDSEINIFVSNVNGGTGGFANHFNSKVVIENFHPALLIHEIGHTLNLDHTFENDFCDDTWDGAWEYDADCDGTIDTQGNDCWDQTPEYNGQLACNGNFCQDHPCCIWQNQNNNIMGYTAWGDNPRYAAFTPCQIGRMLEALSTRMCSYIADFGNCPPPSPIIGTLPLDGLGSDDCEYCIHFEGSMNDRYYKLEVRNTGVNGNSLVLNTGWMDGPADQYCIGLNNSSSNWTCNDSGVLPGETYVFTLYIENVCGDEAMVDKTISIPSCHPCVGPEILFTNITPNPTIDWTTISYTTQDEMEIEILFYDPVNDESTIIKHNATELAGQHQEMLNTSALSTGVYYIIYRTESQIFSDVLIKN